MLGSIAVIAGIWPVILGGAYSMSKHYKKMAEQARREGAPQTEARSCADASASAENCGCKPADHNPEKGQGGGQC